MSLRKTFAPVALVLALCAASIDAQTAAPAQAPAAQPPAAPAPAAPPDFSKVEITTTKLADNIYGLEGQGGRIGLLVGPDGVFMVESQFAPLTEKIVAAIRKVSDGRIRFLINSHFHPDHTGGNENIGKLGATILGRPQVRERLAAASTPAAGLPTVLYEGEMELHLNGEEVRLFALPMAHTDGDTGIYFTKANVLMTGDVFRSFGFPNIDRASGGTLDGMLKAIETLIGMAGPQTKVVPGHGPVTDRNGLIAHRDMILAIRGRVAKMIQEGKTVEQIVAAKPTADFDERTGNVAATADRFVGQVYAELTAKK
jgi:glyoxylase-like metal-dependent hydrolase (beta-lactamase superfamily II)